MLSYEQENYEIYLRYNCDGFYVEVSKFTKCYIKLLILIHSVTVSSEHFFSRFPQSLRKKLEALINMKPHLTLFILEG